MIHVKVTDNHVWKLFLPVAYYKPTYAAVEKHGQKLNVTFSKIFHSLG